MNALMKLAKLLQKRPSDLLIRIIRVAYALLLAAVAYAGWSFDYDWSVFGYLAGYGEYCWYFVGGIALFWLVWAVSPWCLLHRKMLKKIMMGLGIFLMVASIFFADTPVRTAANVSTNPAATASGSVAFDMVVDSAATIVDTRPSMPVRFLMFLLGLVSVGLGVTSKFVTSGCLKYKEKITVIRV